MRAAAAEDAGGDFVEARGDYQDAGFVFLPEEVVRDGVCGLALPGQQAPWLEFPRMPHPPSHNILRAKSLINVSLIFEYILQIRFGHFICQRFIDFPQSIIDIVNICI